MIDSIANKIINEYFTFFNPETVVKAVVITGATTMRIVLSKPTLDAKILRSIVVTIHCCIFNEAILVIADNKK